MSRCSGAVFIDHVNYVAVLEAWQKTTGQSGFSLAIRMFVVKSGEGLGMPLGTLPAAIHLSE